MRRTRDKNQGQIIKGVIFSEMKDVALFLFLQILFKEASCL